MAIKPAVQLAPNVTAPTASYPDGSSKNESAPGNNDGTPYSLTRADDIFGLQQALTKMAGIVASGNADTALDKNSSQYLQAILHAVLGANTFGESGIADAYVLDVVGLNPAPANYSSNMTVNFIPGNTNIGASTVDIEGLGPKSIRSGGGALIGGELVVGVRYTIIYDSVNGWFELITTSGKLVNEVHVSDGLVATGTTVMVDDNTIPQNTEGDEYMSLAITPKDALNILTIEACFYCAHTSITSKSIGGAIFQDAIANALKSGWTAKSLSSNGPSQLIIRFEVVAGSTAARTYKLRAGAFIAGTTTFNGIGGTGRFNGSLGSYMTIKERRP